MDRTCETEDRNDIVRVANGFEAEGRRLSTFVYTHEGQIDEVFNYHKSQ